MDFILGLGIALPIVSCVGISVTTGVAQGVNEQKKQNADAGNAARMLKFHADILTDAALQQPNNAATHLHNRVLTLRDDKCFLDERDPKTLEPVAGHHPFTGFYIAYPDNDRPYTRGLVSTISIDPPILNWIYIDKDTLEAKYASRSGSIMHHVGSYDWTTEGPADSNITLEGHEGFYALEEAPEVWALYFDWHRNGLKAVRKGRQAVPVHLQRKIISGQEVNKWGLKEEGNMGFKATREV